MNETINTNGSTETESTATAIETSQPSTPDALAAYKHENGMLFGKFKDEASLADAYRNLEKKFHEKKPSPPENYEIKIDEKFKGKWDLKNDDPVLNSIIPVLKEAGLSNDSVNKLINSYVEANVSSFVDPKEELAKLGSDGETIINDITSFSKKTGLDLSRYVVTADDAKLFHGLIQRTRDANIPTNLDKGEGKSPEEYRNEARKFRRENEKTIGGNPVQQKIYMDLLNKANGDTNE